MRQTTAHRKISKYVKQYVTPVNLHASLGGRLKRAKGVPAGKQRAACWGFMASGWVLVALGEISNTPVLLQGVAFIAIGLVGLLTSCSSEQVGKSIRESVATESAETREAIASESAETREAIASESAETREAIASAAAELKADGAETRSVLVSTSDTLAGVADAIKTDGAGGARGPRRREGGARRTARS